jgi:hypothetical protein
MVIIPANETKKNLKSENERNCLYFLINEPNIISEAQTVALESYR